MSREQDLAYAAGFIDGDGCFALYKNKGSYRPSLEIAQVTKPILVWLKGVLGFGRIYTRKAVRNNKAAYILALFPSEVRAIIPIIRPYLRVKLKQVILLENYFDVLAQYSYRSKSKRTKLSAIKKRFSRANKRGIQ